MPPPTPLLHQGAAAAWLRLFRWGSIALDVTELVLLLSFLALSFEVLVAHLLFILFWFSSHLLEPRAEIHCSDSGPQSRRNLPDPSGLKAADWAS